MSSLLIPSPSSSNSTTASLTSFSTSTPDSQTSHSSLSQTSQRPRYARRRNVAAFIAQSDSEDDKLQKVSTSRSSQQYFVDVDPSAHKGVESVLDARITPRRMPFTSFRQPSSHHEIRDSTLGPPQQDRPRPAPQAIRLPSTRLGRTNSLPHAALNRTVESEEETGSLPIKLAGLKRGFEADSDEEGGEADDEESQELVKDDHEYNIQESRTHHTPSLPTQLGQLDILSPPELSTTAPNDAASVVEDDIDVDQTFGDEGAEYEPELWDDFWAEDQPLDIDTANIDRTSGSGFEKRERDGDGLLTEAREGEEEDGDAAVFARLMAQAGREQAGFNPGIPAGINLDTELNEDEDLHLLSDEGDDGLLLNLEEDLEEMLHLGEDEEGSRRDRALAYLESLPLKLLSQLNTSLIMLNEYERNRLNPPRANKARGKRAVVQDGEGDEGSQMILDEPDEGDMAESVEMGVKKGKGKAKAGEGAGTDWAHVVIELGLINRKTGVDQVVSFPDEPMSMGIKATSQRKFAEIVRVASLMYEAILTDTVTTKRDIFYKDVALFRTQATVDKLVDDIAATAGLKRQDFMVCATSKGLIASSALKIFLKTGEELSFSATNASLIPPVEKIDFISSDTDEIDWVLIVEKDAVFQTLCGNTLLSDPDLGSGVIITGKGYPDLATLQLVSLIATTFPSAHFHALVDADPHGLDILSVYTLGSQATRFSHDHADLALGERLEWMGVKASEFNALGVRFDDLLPLSEKDVQKAMAMLTTRPDMPDSWRRELVHMLHLNKKAEIQVLAMRGLGLEEGGCDPVEAGQQQDETGMDGDGATVIGMGTEMDRPSWEGAGGGGLVRYVVGKLLGV